MDGEPYIVKPALTKKVVGYHKICGRCKSVLALYAVQMNFDGVTTVICPVCNLSVKFTGDDGFVFPDVKMVYGETKNGQGKKEDKCGPAEGND